MPFLNIFSDEKENNKKQKLEIIADDRELNSSVISDLEKSKVEVKIKHLDVGDFLVGKTMIERKTISDFISSMINKRIFRQLEEIKQYEKYFLLIEGEQKYLFDKKGIHENATRGLLLSILTKYQIPVLFTKNANDTAKFLKVLAKKELKEKKGKSIRPSKKTKTKEQEMQYILEGFEGIGPNLAKKLLEKYGTIKKIINAPIEDLEKLIGKKARVFEILEEKYQKNY